MCIHRECLTHSLSPRCRLQNVMSACVSMSPTGAPVTPSRLRHKCVCTSFLTGPESCLTLAAWGPAGLSNTQLRIMVTTHVTKYTRTSCQSVLQWYMRADQHVPSDQCLDIQWVRGGLLAAGDDTLRRRHHERRNCQASLLHLEVNWNGRKIHKAVILLVKVRL